MRPQRPGLDDRTRTRLRKAGSRFRAAEIEHRAAVAELKRAVLAADGRCSSADAAEITGLPSVLLDVIQPELHGD